MQVVRQADHDDVRRGVLDGGREIRRVLGDRPALAEGRTAVVRPREDDADPVAAALPVQRVRVEVADETGAEHRDRVAVHGTLLDFEWWCAAAVI